MIIVVLVASSAGLAIWPFGDEPKREFNII